MRVPLLDAVLFVSARSVPRRLRTDAVGGLQFFVRAGHTAFSTDCEPDGQRNNANWAVAA
jgi:hypothetical protein